MVINNSTNTSKNVRALFAFTKAEADLLFANARLHKKVRGFTLLVSQKTSSYGKLLIVIPRAVGKAHDRNLLRRRLKAIFYEEKLSEQPFSFILICYKPALEWTFEKLKHFLISEMLRTT